MANLGHHDVWLGLGDVDASLLEQLEVEDFGLVHLWWDNTSSDDDGMQRPPIHEKPSPPLPTTSCLLEVIRRHSPLHRLAVVDNTQTTTTTTDYQHLHRPFYLFRIHPVLYEFLSAAAAEQMGDTHPNSSSQNESPSIELAPLPFLDYPFWDLQHDAPVSSGTPPRSGWRVRPIRRSDPPELPAHSMVHLQILYQDDHGEPPRAPDNPEIPDPRLRWLGMALEGRLLLASTVMLLSTAQGYAVVVILDLTCQGQALDKNVAYRFSHQVLHTLKMMDSSPLTPSCSNFSSSSSSRQEYLASDPPTCPGYEALMDELITLLQLDSRAAPSGVILTGGSGVGKSRLASAVAYHLQSTTTTTEWYVHWVSLHDLLSKASWATEDDLLRELQPRMAPNDAARSPWSRRRVLLILDDVQVLQDPSSTETVHYVDFESRLVLNSVVQVLDDLAARRWPVLALGQGWSELPPVLTKTGRLEKEVVMSPPTQPQREAILADLLRQVPVHVDKQLIWVEALASLTGGCVAGDLVRLVADAWSTGRTRHEASVALTWPDFAEAVRRCIPSELASLDVIKPMMPRVVGKSLPSTWLGIHEQAFAKFIGYDLVKKHLYRSVVFPWRRLLHQPDRTSDHISPPSGVLFHGPSGCGKTMAARCLASSLGLSYINVRAADVLDKWLGGSEAAIRSLFGRARSSAPCILLFDEIDAIASNRSVSGDTVDVMSRLLSTLLNEMDGVSSDAEPRVLVVACTNRLESLDAALLRPGRLEEHIHLDRPTVDDIRLVISTILSTPGVPEDVDVDSMSALLHKRNATCAEVGGKCRDVVMRALKRYTGAKVSEIRLLKLDFDEVIISP